MRKSINGFRCHPAKSFRNLILIITAILIACSNQKTENGATRFFPDIKTTYIAGEKININDVFEPDEIVIRDSFLIIIDSKSEKCLHVYNKNTFEPVKEFGTKGIGPEEFVKPVIAGFERNYHGDKYDLLIFDVVRRRISRINLSEAINNPCYKTDSELLPEKMSEVSNIVFTDDSIALYIPYNEDNQGRFGIYNYSDKSRSFTPYLPTIGFKVSSVNIYPVYATSSFCVNPGKNRFVAIPALLGQLDFFSLDGEYLHSSVIERVKEIRQAKNNRIVFEIPGITYYFTDIVSVNDTICALFTGKQYPDFSNKAVSMIYVFDWEGNPIECYTLDREIVKFTYDCTNRRFIGYSSEDQNDPFIKYDLK